jgi:hypothetical protein
MTISEIRQRIRMEANDDGAVKKREDDYYNTLIIASIELLESFIGKISVRDNSYQFMPIRQSDKTILYKDDDVTPEIDSEIYYDPDDPEDADENIPENVHVNQGLFLASGESSGSLQTADFVDELGMRILEKDMAFIKIQADTVTSEGNTVSFDVSLDNRETWIVADFGETIALDTDGNSGFIDVSKYPSSYVALKWSLTGSASKVRSTTFWRYYVPKEKIRHYHSDIVEIAKMKLLEIKLDHAIKNQNDPMVISGMNGQIENIKRKYGLDKWAGDIQPKSTGAVISNYPGSRAENKVFGYDEGSSDFLTDKRIVGITTTGEIRRT